MATKVGRVAGVDRIGRKFVQLRLATGDTVEVPHQLRDDIQQHAPTEELVFVERRGLLFSYVQWAGTVADAFAAVEAGVLRPEDVAMLTPPARATSGEPSASTGSETKPDFAAMSELSLTADPASLAALGPGFRDRFFEAGDDLWRLLHAAGAEDNRKRLPPEAQSLKERHDEMIRVAVFMALFDRGRDVWPRLPRDTRAELEDHSVSVDGFAESFAVVMSTLMPQAGFSVPPRGAYDVVRGGFDERFDAGFEQKYMPHVSEVANYAIRRADTSVGET